MADRRYVFLDEEVLEMRGKTHESSDKEISVREVIEYHYNKPFEEVVMQIHACKVVSVKLPERVLDLSEKEREFVLGEVESVFRALESNVKLNENLFLIKICPTVKVIYQSINVFSGLTNLNDSLRSKWEKDVQKVKKKVFGSIIENTSQASAGKNYRMREVASKVKKR